MKPVKLTICIPSLHRRSHTLLELLGVLQIQARIEEVEILVTIDHGQDPVGTKRNAMVDRATGQYICHIDDDDLVSVEYIPTILKAIDDHAGVDAILVRGRRTMRRHPPVEFDYRIGGQEGAWEKGVMWRSPGHLCPIRTELARKVRFPLIRIGEDLVWNADMAQHLYTSARAGAPGQVLYYYRYEPGKGMRRPHLKEREVPNVNHRPDTTTMTTDLNHAAIFTPQYKHASGPGSTAAYSAPYRAFLEQFIHEHKIGTILDLGCGDLEVMSRVKMNGARYTGVDVIAERVRMNKIKHKRLAFQVGDARSWKIPTVDLLICKDVLQHWSSFEVRGFLDRLASSSFKYALITNCNYGETVNSDIATGGWRAIDLTKPPFEMGEVVFKWDTKDVVLVKGS